MLCALVFHDREIHAVLCDVYNVSLLFLFFISLIFSVFSYGFHNALSGLYYIYHLPLQDDLHPHLLYVYYVCGEGLLTRE